MEKENLILDKTLQFSLTAIEFYKKLYSKNEFVLSKQFLRAATSIGANVNEATAAQTKKDFIAKMSIASKEARETKYWIILLDKSRLIELDYSTLLIEINSIIKILTSIVKTSQENLLN